MQDRIGASILEMPTTEQRGTLRKILRTPYWSTLEILMIPASRVTLDQVPRDLIEPTTAVPIREQTFVRKLRDRQNDLTRVNPNSVYRIHPDTDREGATNYPALFEVLSSGGERMVMWDGPTVTLAQSGPKWDGENFSVPTYPIRYSEWVACQNFRYAEAFRGAGLSLPYAGVGISVLMETTDGMIPLTRRGVETPVYSGMLYSPGGGPKPGQNSTEALMEEILEETGLQTGKHFNPADLTMLALVSDTRFHESDHQRPELIAYLPVNVTFRELEEIQRVQAENKGLKETDVWKVDAFSANLYTLPDGILFYSNQLCPPTEAGLVNFVLFEHLKLSGPEVATQKVARMMRKMELYRREPYIVPITRLGDFLSLESNAS